MHCLYESLCVIVLGLRLCIHEFLHNYISTRSTLVIVILNEMFGCL